MLDKEQLLAYNLSKEGKDVFVGGKAGTGKSYLINKLRDLPNSVVLSTTGISAYNIGGQTFHSFFSLFPNGVFRDENATYVSGKKRELWSRTQTVIIDEVSMLRPDYVDGMFRTFQINNIDISEMNFVFIGDMKQLEAVITPSEKMLYPYRSLEFFESRNLKKREIHKVELQHIRRQKDPEFIENLNIIRDGGFTPYFNRFKQRNFVYTSDCNSIYMAYDNATVDRINKISLDSNPNKSMFFKGKVSGNYKDGMFLVPQQIELKDGSPVMCVANVKEAELFNGMTGTLLVKKRSLFLVRDGKEYQIDPFQFNAGEYLMINGEIKFETTSSLYQYPIKMCAAITVHKSQGLGFDKAVIDTRNFRDRRVTYVAYSRMKSTDKLIIL